MIAAAVVLVVAAVVVSVTIGSGGGGDASSSTTASTEPAASVAPTTTSPARVVQLGAAPLLGEPTGLALLAGGSRLSVIDLDRATLTWVPSPARVMFAASATPVGLAYEDATDGGYYVAAPGDSAPRLLGANGAYLGEGPAGRAWFRLVRSIDDVVSLVHGDAPGEAPVAADLPDGVSGAYPDGAGGLVTGAGGGIYHVEPGSQPVRLATGDLLSASGGHARARSCDDALRCQYLVIDIDSGDVRRGPSTSGGDGHPLRCCRPIARGYWSSTHSRR